MQKHGPRGPWFLSEPLVRIIPQLCAVDHLAFVPFCCNEKVGTRRSKLWLACTDLLIATCQNGGQWIDRELFQKGCYDREARVNSRNAKLFEESWTGGITEGPKMEREDTTKNLADILRYATGEVDRLTSFFKPTLASINS